MPPKDVTIAGQEITDRAEGLIRRGRRPKNQQNVVEDQITGRLRVPAAIFQPRSKDAFLSVNIQSSLVSAGLPRDWGCDHQKFYAALLLVGACSNLDLRVTWEPVANEPDQPDNPHHGGIHGVVELQQSDRDAYERTITKLAKESVVLPECLDAASKTG